MLLQTRKQNYLIHDEEQGEKKICSVCWLSKENNVNIITEALKAAQEKNCKQYIKKNI